MSRSYHAGSSTPVGSTADNPVFSGISDHIDISFELLILELTRYYHRQDKVSAGHAVETLGFRVGSQLAERLTMQLPRMTEPLDKVKFVCKEFWMAVFKKQATGLKTNHKGRFVMEDLNLRWLEPLRNRHAADKAPPQACREIVELYITLACGFLKGALFHLNMACTITGTTNGAPHCKFTIDSNPAPTPI